MAPIHEENPPRLPAGTQLGSWRVEAWRGQGTYGVVYRAVRADAEDSAPVALKLARFPSDARFVREVELLSRLSHPSIPRLLDRGVLRFASGTEYPWLVMEWVEGTALYTWSEQHAPSYPRVCELLAQLARALEAMHTAGAVHRDVKGDNVLVRHSDGRAMLIDLGSGHFQGAPRLTWRSLAPGTFAYQSAKACLFHIRCAREPDGYYAPTPADDLFALGVTAYRLVMGEYPPPMDAQEDEQGGWHVASPDPRLRLERCRQLQPLLREWILRLLSDVPEARGTATELAEALEAEAREHVAKLRSVALPSGEGEERSTGLAWERGWRPWLVLAAATVPVVFLCVQRQPEQAMPGQVTVSATGEAGVQVPDAGAAAVGDITPTEPPSTAPSRSERKSVAQDSPYIPGPEQPRRQTRPDAKGRCPGSMQVAFKGGCWVEQTAPSAEACVENGFVLFRGKCYTPALEVPQKSVPTSNPAKEH